MRTRRKRKVVPMQEYRRVIKLEDRGPERVLKGGVLLFAALAIICVLYCLAIGLFMGYGTKFFLIWAAMGFGFAVIALFCGKPALRRKLPHWLIRMFWICFGIGLAIFFLVEGLVLTRYFAKAEDDADYVVILGAQWKTHGPSYVLKLRLDKAIAYLNENPMTKVVVSGGQGSNEPISEAEGMYGYLVDAGIAPERIVKEDASTNTYENLRYTSALIDKEKDSIVLVTNNFHVYRAEKLAKAQGYQHVQALAADSYLAMQPNNLLREFFGVVKDFLMGNLVRWERTEA